MNIYSEFIDVIVDGEEFSMSRKEAETLEFLGILAKVSSPQRIWCPTCQDEDVEIVLVTEGKAYTICGQNEEASRDYFDPRKLKQWQFCIEPFLVRLQKSLGIKHPKISENLGNLLYSFGRQEVHGTNYQLFFCRNIDQISTPEVTILTSQPQSAVFHLGTPKKALPDKIILVPLVDLLKKVTKKGLQLKQDIVEQFFSYEVYASSAGDIELDEDVILQGQCLLYGSSRGGVFRDKSEALRPLAVRIIEHLFGIRMYQINAKTLDELASDLGSTKVTISNEIGRIREICEAHNLQPILHKFPGHKWGINPMLSSRR